MTKKKSVTYRDAGVDIDAADATKRRIARLVKSTETSKTLGTFGLFGGALEVSFPGSTGMTLVGSIDGVGTKTIIARMAGRFDTVGVDIVSHCVNDVLCQGATPLFFMDYVASSKLEPNQVVDIVRGVTAACRDNRLVLLGGETAEMPGVYREGAFDLVGVLVGLLHKEDFISGSNIRAGDILIGLPSSGLHTNGFSLVRKVFFDIAKANLHTRFAEMPVPLGEVLLTPHFSYLDTIRTLRRKVQLKGLAHITGGGISGNLCRIVPSGLSAHVDIKGFTRHPIFDVIARLGNVPRDDMYRTFNMGIGMVACVAPPDADTALSILRRKLKGSRIIGEIQRGRRKVVLEY